jgi:uncharacterized protein (UPF0335 family)
MSDAFNYDTGSSGADAEEELAKGAAKKPTKRKVKRASRKKDNQSDSIGDAAQNQLKSFVQRVERLEEEKAELSADIKEVYAEAKAMGYDTKVLRKVVSERKKDRQEREEQQALFELYWGAVEGYIERSDAAERGEEG